MKEETEISKEIIKIQEDLEMTGRGMAKGMAIDEATFRKKKSKKEVRHWFNQQNLDDLKSFLKTYVNKL